MFGPQPGRHKTPITETDTRVSASRWEGPKTRAAQEGKRKRAKDAETRRGTIGIVDSALATLCVSCRTMEA